MTDVRTPASVRRELNEKFEAFAIFKRDRATALYHFCVALELLPVPLSVDSGLALAKGRHATEATMRAIPMIFRLCPVITAAPIFNVAVLAEAAKLIDFASRVDQIMYCYELADRGQFDVRYDPLSQQTMFT